MKYRKKPVVIEAERYVGFNGPDLAAWCGGRVCVGHIDPNTTVSALLSQRDEWIEIETLEGVMRADLGDYIIRGVRGEFYPCKPDIFEATYEAVSE